MKFFLIVAILLAGAQARRIYPKAPSAFQHLHNHGVKNSKEGDDGTITPPPGSPLCKSPGFIFPDPTDCDSFFVCDNLQKPVHYTCPYGQLFNPATNRCDDPTDVTCFTPTTGTPVTATQDTTTEDITTTEPTTEEPTTIVTTTPPPCETEATTSESTPEPTTEEPTTTEPTTEEPTTIITTTPPACETESTPEPTHEPTTEAPIPEPTEAPTTPEPTEAPTTPEPTEAPTTPEPTEAPTTPEPTEAPTTPEPTEAPTTPEPTEAPTPPSTPSTPVPPPCETDPAFTFTTPGSSTDAPITEPSTTDAPTPDPTTATTPETTTPFIPVCISPGEVISDIQNCSVYYVCTPDQDYVTLVCPDGLYWNTNTAKCDDPQNVQCPPPSSQRKFRPQLPFRFHLQSLNPSKSNGDSRPT